MGKKQNKFNDYDGFTEKFKPKRTTDDCYTPPEVYEAIKKWVFRECALPDDTPIVRPFYPGGDYERAEYPDGCVVLDNPPFSILADILRYYKSRGIRFFLFAPAQTLFSPHIEDLTYIIPDVGIIYENGADIRTAFVTNLPHFEEYIVIGAPDLRDRIKEAQEKKDDSPKKTLPIYSYPDHIVSVSSVARLVNAGLSPRVPRGEAEFTRQLDEQKGLRKHIFGSGLIVSDEQAEKLKAEKLKAEKRAFRFELSDREREIVRRLSSHPSR